MKDDEKDLLETFGKLTSENRNSLLTFAHVAPGPWQGEATQMEAQP
jgi:hypothetical protein